VSEAAIILVAFFGFGLLATAMMMGHALADKYLEAKKIQALPVADLTQRVEQLSAIVERLDQRLENLELIVTSQDWETLHGLRRLESAPEQESERLAQRIRRETS
jgi:hypothetical protein